MVDIVHRRPPPCLDVSKTYAELELAHQLLLQALVAPPRKGGKSLWGQEAEMKKLMMVIVIGLALATTGFAQGRGGSRSGGGHSYGVSGGRSYGGGGFSYSGRGFGGQFPGQTARGRFEGGFSGYRGGYGYGRSSFGFGFSYAPGPYWAGYYGYPYPYCGYGPVYCPPAYYPGPVVGVGVIRGGFVGGRAFVGRGGDWHRFSRR